MDGEDMGILITNVKNDASENEIRNFFGTFGTIVFVKIIPDKFNEGSNICYMKFSSEECAKTAVRDADKSTHFGTMIRVSLKKITSRSSFEKNSKSSVKGSDDKPNYRQSNGEHNLSRQSSSQHSSGRGRGFFKSEMRSPGSVNNVTLKSLEVALHLKLLSEIIELNNLNDVLIRPLDLTEQTKAEIENKLARYNDNVSDLVKISNPKVGSYCLARWKEDEQFYRAKITEVSGTQYRVCFVDEGNSGDLVDEIKEIPNNLKDIPCQFLNCTLNCKESADFINYILQECTTKGVSIYICNYSEDKVLINLFIGDKDAVDGFKEDTLKDVRKNPYLQKSDLMNHKIGIKYDNFQLIEQMKGKDMAKLVILDPMNFKPKIKPITNLPITGDLVMYAQTHDFLHRAIVTGYSFVHSKIQYSLSLIDEDRVVEGVSVDQIMFTSDDSFKQPARVIKCRFSKPNIEIAKSGSIKILNYDNKSDQYEVEFICDTVVTNVDKEVKVGEFKDGFITHIESASEIYVQFADSTNELTHLEDILLNYKGTAIKELEQLNVNDMVVAPFDGVLYRARVKQLKKNTALVHFIDYGNSDEVAAVEILEANREMMKMQPLAKICKLCGNLVEGKNNEIVELINEYCDNMSAMVSIKIISQDATFAKIDVVLSGKKSLVEVLKSKNFLKDESPISKENKNVPATAKLNGYDKLVKCEMNKSPRKNIESLSDVELTKFLFQLEERVCNLEKFMRN